MAHHAEDLPIDMKELADAMKLGATGRFPLGKLNNADEGELSLAIGAENGKVVMNFGKKCSWIGFSPEQAIDIASTLIRHANNIRFA